MPNEKQLEGEGIHLALGLLARIQSITARKAWHLESLVAVAVGLTHSWAGQEAEAEQEVGTYYKPQGPLLSDPLPP